MYPRGIALAQWFDGLLLIGDFSSTYSVCAVKNGCLKLKYSMFLFDSTLINNYNQHLIVY